MIILKYQLFGGQFVPAVALQLLKNRRVCQTISGYVWQSITKWHEMTNWYWQVLIVCSIMPLPP